MGMVCVLLVVLSATVLCVYWQHVMGMVCTVHCVKCESHSTQPTLHTPYPWHAPNTHTIQSHSTQRTAQFSLPINIWPTLYSLMSCSTLCETWLTNHNSCYKLNPHIHLRYRLYYTCTLYVCCHINMLTQWFSWGRVNIPFPDIRYANINENYWKIENRFNYRSKYAVMFRILQSNCFNMSKIKSNT